MVGRINLDREIFKEWDALGRDTRRHFTKETDYQKVFTTRPHESLANLVFQHGDEVSLSRFEQKDAFCLSNMDQRIDIGLEGSHDGHVFGSKAYYTTVDGHVVVAKLATCAV